MTKRPRVLIGTLFSDVKDYAIREFFNNVRNFTYPEFDICFVDNSKDKKYHKKMFRHFNERKGKSNIKKLTVLHTPRIDERAEVFMAFSANELRNHFLRGGYDALLNLESDVISPTDIIERLLSYNLPVVGATYFSGEKSDSYPMIIEHYVYNNDFGMSIDNPSYIKGFYEMTDTFEPKRYFGEGIGCIMLSRDVVKMIPFRADPVGKAFHDSIFFYDLLANNIQNYLVPIMCRHENQIWQLQRKMISGKR